MTASHAGRVPARSWPLEHAHRVRFCFMSKPAGEIGHLRNEELPAVRVIVPPNLSGRVFDDDLDAGDVVFDGNLTAMLVWHERCPLGRGWRSGWVLSYDTDGKGNPDDYIVGLSLAELDAAVTQAREYLRSMGYPAGGWSLGEGRT